MAAATSRSPTRAQQYGHVAARLIAWVLLGALGLLIALQLVFFATHVAHLLGYPYPLDYGEGPLLAQVNLLRAGTPIWRLYADPDQAPYAIVNYPPVYHLITALVALPLGNALLAGRLVSLASALAATLALWLLAGEPRTENRESRTREPENREPQNHRTAEPQNRRTAMHNRLTLRVPVLSSRFLVVLAFLALPIVREWAVVMRVDMLGVALGLWGLVLVRRNAGRSAVLWAALPLALCLLVKPSLIAAPTAALLWLLFRDWRRALLLGALMAVIGGVSVALLQLGSGGWFTLHVLAANANPWDRMLAYKFWHDQLAILWPLVAAAILSVIVQVVRGDWRLEIRDWRLEIGDSHANLLLPIYYTLFGALVALTVGKVGAYANYFLEFYAGLIWLAASATNNQRRATNDEQLTTDHRPTKPFSIFNFQFSILILLMSGSLLRYYPTWSETYLKLAGIIEGRNPARVIVGGYGVWQDLRRERDILATLDGVNAALISEVRATDAPIFTDVPGVAAQAGQLARLQAFEYRQLLDTGLANQRPLLRDMANGRVPLVVLDYLGNWLTPEAITLITHRYAQDGSRGTYDLYRPVDPGQSVPLNLAFPNNLHLAEYHLAASPGGYHSGENVLLTLDWRQAASADTPIDVVVQLTDAQGQTLLESTRPLLYGALPPSGWGEATVQHMQPFALPPELPAATYQIAIGLRSGGRDLGPAQVIGPLIVAQPDGRIVGEGGYYVPAPLLAAWKRLGGDEGPGDALMPATPFAGFTLQCFARACLKLVGNDVQRVALGEIVHLADVALPLAPAVGEESQARATALSFPETGQTLTATFLDYWRNHGGEAVLGPPITPELIRGDQIVQYTRYARLERPVQGGPARLGQLGEEFLRLPGGVAYRWP